MTDKNGIQWDIVKVEPSDNDVKITFRINNNTGVAIDLFCFAKEHGDESFAIDTNSNQDNNKYVFGDRFATVVPHGNPVNVFLTLKKVPITTSYLGYIQFSYNIGSKGTVVKFTGVHIPR